MARIYVAMAARIIVYIIVIAHDKGGWQYLRDPIQTEHDLDEDGLLDLDPDWDYFEAATQHYQ
jgi:hypothetical protein|tara:strand:- start:874 stop:1062 length:189 start_codon:yes stop_codon:yes gene_type:complete